MSHIRVWRLIVKLKLSKIYTLMSSLYLAAWPNLTFTLVFADSEDDAKRELDQLGSPGAAKIKEYRGPLLLDFEWHLNNPTDAEVPEANVRLSGDERTELYDRVLEFAFPHLHSYYEAVQEGNKEPSLKEAKAALSFDKETFPEQATESSGSSDLDDKMDDLFDWDD